MDRKNQQKGISFVATGRSGLGHLRRVSTIAGALRRMAPDVPLKLLTNAPPTGLEASDLSVYDDIGICDRQDMAGALAQSKTELAVFDTIVVPGAGRLPQKLALILRETPDERLTQFALQGGRKWDALLIPNPGTHWLPAAGQVAARRIFPLGWIYRRPDEPYRPGTRKPLLLVATGGGGTRDTVKMLYPLIDAIIATARRITANPLGVRQAIGPRAHSFGALDTVDEVVDPGGTLNLCFARADIVISTAGYNSVLELAVTDTPALLVPIPRSLDDQAQRVRKWGPKLGFGADPDRPESAARWLADQIANPRRRRPVDLGPSGEKRAARILLEMLT